MKPQKIITQLLIKAIAFAALFTFSGICFGANLTPIIDDFSDPKNNSIGIPRQFLNDTVAGGKTTTEQSVSKGHIALKGDIIPPRGQPGWASTILLLDPQGLPRDASAFKGIRLLIKINTGNVSISANSTEVTNFDYHAASIAVTLDDQFHEVKIPFTSMKRAWSEQTMLNTKTISGLSIVAYSLQKGSFDFEVDEVSFY